MTISAVDVARWIEEAGPALRGGFVHRVWRDEDAWVLLVRHHEGGDPEQRAESRVALEVAVAQEWARCVALPPDLVSADDDRLRKEAARDGQPLIVQLRRQLVGARVDAVVAVPGEKIAWLDASHPGDVPDDGPRHLRLIVELIGKKGNIIFTGRGEADGPPVILATLEPGKGTRTLEKGARYAPPPPRPPRPEGAQPEGATIAPDVVPDPRELPLGKAVAAEQRAKAEAASHSSRHGALLRACRQALKRGAGIVHKLELQLAEVAKADEHERHGDLLKANLHAIPRGASEARLADPTSGAEVVIALDPKEPVLDQMQALYKRAKKLRSGEVAVQQRLGENDRTQGELRALQERLEATAEEDDPALDVLEAALRKLGAVPKAPAGGPRPKVQENLGPRSFRTKEGHEVLVGRNDDENDHLTMRTARGNDLFFHARGCPGSHVILRVDPKRPPNHESILDAATLAVHYSKARSRGAADVSYTPRKWVKKPRGAKPGLVQISNEKTVRAGNDPERLARVLATSARRDEEDA